MTDSSIDPAVFALAPEAEVSLFANARLTPEQLASAARVREHAVSIEIRAVGEADASGPPAS